MIFENKTQNIRTLSWFGSPNSQARHIYQEDNTKSKQAQAIDVMCMRGKAYLLRAKFSTPKYNRHPKETCVCSGQNVIKSNQEINLKLRYNRNYVTEK